MGQINKHEHNIHNGRRANGWERQARPNLRARNGQYAGTVTPRAKTPAVQILTISNVPSDVLNVIDDLAARQDRSRSSFIRRELQRIAAGHRAKAA